MSLFANIPFLKHAIVHSANDLARAGDVHEAVSWSTYEALSDIVIERREVRVKFLYGGGGGVLHARVRTAYRLHLGNAQFLFSRYITTRPSTGTVSASCSFHVLFFNCSFLVPILRCSRGRASDTEVFSS